MPLDISLFRAHAGGNPDLIRESQRRRFASVELVDEIIAKDDKWRYMTGSIDDLKKRRNIIQKDVATKKKAGENCDDLVLQIKSFGDEIIQIENEQKSLRIEIDQMISKIGNIVEDSVPISKDEDADNLVIKKWGTPRDPTGLLSHHELLWRIGGYEPERGANVAGHRGYFLKDVGVLLNQAFINYGISFLRERKYTVLQPPYMMKKDIMAGVAQLEQFDEELYKVGGDADDKYLIATSEQPICAYHLGEWMDEKSLPIRYSGISTCFRKEAGSHGKDTWGIFRVHQFEKIEQFAIVEGDLSVSQRMQDEMIATAEEFYQSLGFPYHVISIVSGALNNAAIKKYDLEAWFPGYNAYRELVSCSNCTDYQSRAMEIRCGTKKLGDREKKYVHMLNATLCATGRAICCLLETYQEKDGVRIPEVLIPYMGGITFLPFVREAKDIKDVGKTTAAKVTTVKTIEKTSDLNIPKPPVAIQVVNTTTIVDAVETLQLNNITDQTTASAIVTAKITESKGLSEEEKAKELKKKEKKEKKDAKKESKKEIFVNDDKSRPPEIPILPPHYTSPAPTKSNQILSTTATDSSLTASQQPMIRVVPTIEECVVDNELVDVQKLDQRLHTFSFVNGFKPSALDAIVFEAVKKSHTDLLTSSRNVTRWLTHINTYTTEQKLAWV